MSVVYTVKENLGDLWSVCRGHTYLETRLGMNEAIRKAGQLARDHHHRTGMVVSVELDSHEGKTVLSRYARPGTDSESVAA
jgi:hypothetical protein